MLINFPAMTPNMVYAALFYDPIEHRFGQDIPFEAAQDFSGPELRKTSGMPQVKAVIIDVQRSSRLVGIVHCKCVSGHGARISESGILDKLHMQLGIGASWITKCLDLLAGNLLKHRLRLGYLSCCLLLGDGRQSTMRHRMSADLEILAQIPDLRQR